VYTKAVAVKTLVVEFQHSAISLAFLLSPFQKWGEGGGYSKRVGPRSAEDQCPFLELLALCAFTFLLSFTVKSEW